MLTKRLLCAAGVVAAVAACGTIGQETIAQEPDAGGKKAFRIEQDIVYATPGGVELRLDAYLPNGTETTPAVLVVHGGAWRGGSKQQLALYARELAARGYAAFAISYRLAPDHRFPAQIEDCRAAVKWIRKNAKKYRVDPKRIGAVGYSAGGHLVALLGCTGADKEHADTRLAAVVAGGAPCDFRDFPARAKVLADWLGGTRQEAPDVYTAASPAAFVSAKAPPMFFYHGTDDRIVKSDDPAAMVKALKEAGVEAELYLVEGAGHIAAALNDEARRRAWQFLDNHLRAKR